MAPMIRTVICDDSNSFRAALSAVLDQRAGFELIGQAANGEEAIRLVRNARPDLVVMDVVMPGIDGLAATAEIMRESPCPVVVISSLVDADSQKVIFEAMQAGAVEVMRKPRDLADRNTREALIASLKAMAAVKVVRRRRDKSPPLPRTDRTDVQIIAIGASTGGPPALCGILGQLPANFPAPIVIAQHLAFGFADGLRRWLADVTPLKVKLVAGSMPLIPGEVYLPHDGYHLAVEGLRVNALSAGSDVQAPSVDKLFTSVLPLAKQTVGVLLTGMGQDGARALLKLREAGAYCIVQDEASSLVYGMPRVAKELGAANEELPAELIGWRLLQVTGEKARPE